MALRWLRSRRGSGSSQTPRKYAEVRLGEVAAPARVVSERLARVKSALVTVARWSGVWVTPNLRLWTSSCLCLCRLRVAQ